METHDSVVYPRILLKLSGEALRSSKRLEIDPEVVKRIANEIKDVQSLGVEVGIVIGGGISKAGDQLFGPLNAELRFTWLGGATILSRTRKSAYNVFEQRPKLSKWDYVKSGGRALFRIERMHRRMKHLFQPAERAM